MHSLLPNLSTTLITLLATLSLATAAPAQVPPVGPGPVIIAEYITYSDTACTHVIAHENIAPQTQCKGLPEANSLEATFDDDEGTGSTFQQATMLFSKVLSIGLVGAAALVVAAPVKPVVEPVERDNSLGGPGPAKPHLDQSPDSVVPQIISGLMPTVNFHHGPGPLSIGERSNPDLVTAAIAPAPTFPGNPFHHGPEPAPQNIEKRERGGYDTTGWPIKRDTEAGRGGYDTTSWPI
ncbi:MAG: hypothetical protein MMC33_000601 [Icmadophila ericetorum]|nr:hypothetical protein [Icmadophila ericetorum]